MKPINKQCQGCGITLQVTDSHMEGYALSADHKYCQSCFKLANYGIATKHKHPHLLPEFKSGSLVIVITSVLFLDTLFQMNLNRLTDNKIVYVVNQIDLLPTDTNLDLLLENIERKAKFSGAVYDDMILMSAHNDSDLENLKIYLQHRREKTIYLVGIQNSGKTTIFKYLTGNKEALNLKKAALTLETLKGMLGKKEILDTPGLYQKGYLHESFDYDVYKKILPDKTMRPVIYNLSVDSAVIIDGLVSIDIIKQDKSSYVFYLNQHLKLHKTNVLKVEKLLEHADKHFTYRFDKYIQTTYQLPKNIKYQITLADFGFIHLVGPATIRIWHPSFMHITQMEALFK